MPHIYAGVVAALVSFSTWLLRRHLIMHSDLLKAVLAELSALRDRVAHLEKETK